MTQEDFALLRESLEQAVAFKQGDRVATKRKTMKTIDEFFEEQKIRLPIGAYPVEEISLSVPLSELVRKYCDPPLGAEHFFPKLFGKYGYTYAGICDGWNWTGETLDIAPEDDLWKMLAITSTYWYLNYQKWFDEMRSK